MLTRIRYKKVGEKTLKSVRTLRSSVTGATYTVTLDLENYTYLIRNLLSYRKYEGGEKVNNLAVLKRNVKKRLKKLGVKFDHEIRDISERKDNAESN